MTLRPVHGGNVFCRCGAKRLTGLVKTWMDVLTAHVPLDGQSGFVPAVVGTTTEAVLSQIWLTFLLTAASGSKLLVCLS